MIGLAFTGIFADRYGQRWTIIGALALVVSTCRPELDDQYG
jgi:MFS family permease